MALEIMHQLRRISFNGHIYFDTFPQRTDPVEEAEFNVARVKSFWAAAGSMDQQELERVANTFDAIGALRIVQDALRKM
jgi:xylose isomerase